MGTSTQTNIKRNSYAEFTSGFTWRGLHTFGESVLINHYYVNGIPLSHKLSNKLTKTKDFLNRKTRDPEDQHTDLGPEQLLFNDFTEFVANNAKNESKFNFFGFSNKISFIIFLVFFFFTFGRAILSLIRLWITIKKNYSEKSDNYVERINNKQKIRDEFRKRLMKVAKKKFGDPSIDKYFTADDPLENHKHFINTLDHHTFSRFKLSDPIYDSTDYLKSAREEEIHVRNEMENYVIDQTKKRNQQQQQENVTKKQQHFDEDEIIYEDEISDDDF